MRSKNYDIDWSAYFEYSEHSPSGLVWKISKGAGTNQVKKGQPAGSLMKRNRWVVGLFGKVYSVHTIVWCLFNKLTNDLIVDHINGNGADNRITNLRQISQKENCRNKKKQSNNSSGVTGVSYHNRDKYWSVTYTLDSTLQFERFYDKNYGGKDESFKAAKSRRQHLESTVLNLAGYTERHGKDLHDYY